MGFRARVGSLRKKLQDGPLSLEPPPEQPVDLRRKLSASDVLVMMHPDPHIEELHIHDKAIQAMPPRRHPVRSQTAPAVLQSDEIKTRKDMEDGWMDALICVFAMGAVLAALAVLSFWLGQSVSLRRLK